MQKFHFKLSTNQHLFIVLLHLIHSYTFAICFHGQLLNNIYQISKCGKCQWCTFFSETNSQMPLDCKQVIVKLASRQYKERCQISKKSTKVSLRFWNSPMNLLIMYYFIPPFESIKLLFISSCFCLDLTQDLAELGLIDWL